MVEWGDVHLRSPREDAVRIANEAVVTMDDDLMRVPEQDWLDGDPSSTKWFDMQIVWPA